MVSNNKNEEIKNPSKAYANMEAKFTGKPMWKIIIKMSLPSFIIMLFLGAYTFTDVILSVQFAGDFYKSESGLMDKIIADPYLTSVVFKNLNINGLTNEQLLEAADWSALVRTLMNILGPMILILNSVNMLFTAGLSSRVAINMGKGDIEKAKLTIRSSTMFGMYLFLLVIPIMLLTAEPMMAASSSRLTAELAFPYVAIIIGSFHITFLVNVFNVLLRNEGKNLALLFVQIGPIFFNLFADWIFMGPLKMGIEGGAIATLIANVITFMFIVIVALKNKSELLDFKSIFNWHIKWITLVGVLLIGMSPAIRNVGNAISNIIANGVNKDVSVGVGKAPGYLASIAGTINTVYNLAFPALFGVVLGAMPVVSFHYGMKNYDKVKEGYVWTLVFATLVGLATYLIFAFGLSTPLLKIMGAKKGTSEFNDMKVGLWYMMIALPAFGICMAGMVLFASTDSMWKSFVANILPGFVFLVPSIFIFKEVAISAKDVNYFWLYSPFAILISGIFITGQSVHTLRTIAKNPDRETMEDKITKLNLIYLRSLSKRSSAKIDKWVALSKSNILSDATKDNYKKKIEKLFKKLNNIEVDEQRLKMKADFISELRQKASLLLEGGAENDMIDIFAKHDKTLQGASKEIEENEKSTE